MNTHATQKILEASTRPFMASVTSGDRLDVFCRFGLQCVSGIQVLSGRRHVDKNEI